METFILERTDLNPTTAGRWRGEPDLFKEVCGKTYLHQLTGEDVFAYRKWYADHGRHETTIANRTSSLFTFCRRFDVLWQQFTKSEYKQLTRRDDGPVDYYNENDPDELKRLFAQCADEQRLAYMFFLHTGAREKAPGNIWHWGHAFVFLFFSALNFAHRAFDAFEIFALAAADITRFLT